ncbi:MAG: hypothetical protein ACTHU0_08695, partial [Kofleriaceae bacterium]
SLVGPQLQDLGTKCLAFFGNRHSPTSARGERGGDDGGRRGITEEFHDPGEEEEVREVGEVEPCVRVADKEIPERRTERSRANVREA